MAISAIGQRISMRALRHGGGVALVFLMLSGYFYLPPVAAGLARGAHEQCNVLTGSTYRDYRLVWHTTTLNSLSRPRWMCYDTREPGRSGMDLGWYAGM